ncbi:hypothetical protein L0U85_00890 [Glycomyces sp. L485]|uniref:hypothetical protein n=1 Tax=Glycomyces sp. L485 TaxID=2909235 RepID=UPI001F4B138C|nr:hypothetical protein [Glycomyces sp. L485]MCH7229423.1 hypothetical protein [Glycomyces sp. L485]
MHLFPLQVGMRLGERDLEMSGLNLIIRPRRLLVDRDRINAIVDRDPDHAFTCEANLLRLRLDGDSVTGLVADLPSAFDCGLGEALQNAETAVAYVARHGHPLTVVPEPGDDRVGPVQSVRDRDWRERSGLMPGSGGVDRGDEPDDHRAR